MKNVIISFMDKKKKNKDVLKNTTNRKLFNKAYKKQLEKEGKIRCSYCKFNKNENYQGNFYGGFDNNIKYPSWKFRSKNRKQWMRKKYLIIKETIRTTYIKNKQLKWVFIKFK